MDIRLLTAEDFDDVAALVQYAFQMTFTEEQLHGMRERFRPGELLGAFDEDGRLLAQIQVHDLAVYVNGEAHRMGGVASVASWPEHRRQGSVAGLIGNALQLMRERGQTVSLLSPFSFAFYRKYGWEMLTAYKRYTIETALLPKRAATEGRVERRNGDIALLKQVYDRYAPRFNGMMVRTEAWWKESVLRRKPGHTAFYFAPDGEPTGYVQYEIAKAEMTVRELVTLDEQARRGLWTFLANHDSMITQAVVEMSPQDDMLPFLLENPRIKQELVPYFMARIVDFHAFAEALAFEKTGVETSLTMRVRDAYAPWNEGVWKLAVDGEGKASLRRIGGADPGTGEDAVSADGSSEGASEANAAAVDLEWDIQSATAALFGYMRPEALRECGRLLAGPEAAARLERIVPRRTTFLLDFF